MSILIPWILPAERLDPEVEQLKFLVASLEAGVRFGGCLREALGTIIQLLASATTTDVQEAVTLLMTFRQFQVDGTGQALRRMLPLVFSREQGAALMCYSARATAS